MTSRGSYQRVGRNYSSSGQGEGRSCYSCGESGHLSRDCSRRGGGRKYGHAGNSGGGGGGGRSCFFCRDPGHLIKDCPHRSNGIGDGSDRGARSCFRCGDPGHLDRDCRRRSGGRGGDRGGRSSLNSGERGALARNVRTPLRSYCSRCGEVGHSARDCGQSVGNGSAFDSNSNAGGGEIEGDWIEAEMASTSNPGDNNRILPIYPQITPEILPSSSGEGRNNEGLLGRAPIIKDYNCFRCGGLGHLARDCRRPSCRNSGERGAMARNVFRDRCLWLDNGGSFDCNSETGGGLSVIEASYSNEGDRDEAMSSGGRIVAEMAFTSNEGDRDEAMSSGGRIVAEMASTSNEGDRDEAMSSGDWIVAEMASTSNEGDNDRILPIHPPIAADIIHSFFGEGHNDRTLFGGGPIIINITSSSSSEGEEDDDGDSNGLEGEKEDFDVTKITHFLDMRLKTEDTSWEGDGDGNDDCCILDFNPFEPPDTQFEHKLFVSTGHQSIPQDDDISIISERGQVACRDYPHSRHLCVKNPFHSTPHESCCPQCYCYVCDSAAPCKYWKENSGHCHASDQDMRWKYLRLARRAILEST